MWQPIETAPVETDIIIYDPAVGVSMGYLSKCRDCYDWGNADYNGPMDANPTHWQPLPEPPVE